MLGNMIGAIARMDEIKSNFKTAMPQGRVNIAPHAASSGPPQAQSLDSSFSSYLQKASQSPQQKADTHDSSYDGIIETASKKYGIDPALVKAVVRAESGYRPDAMSRAGAQGLMQLMPGTARGLGVSDPFDPAQNIDGGVRYLKSQMDRFGDVKLALAAYNAGPGAVTKYGGVPPYKETQDYVNKVLSYREDYASR